MFIEYIKHCIPDFALCTAMSLCLSFNIIQGFTIPQEQLSNRFGFIMLSLLLLVLCFAGAYNKKTVILSVLLWPAFIITIACIGASQGNVDINQYAFYIIIAATALAVFLLSRSYYGTIFLFFTGIMVFFVIVLLAYDHFDSLYIFFLLSAACMFFLKKYVHSALHTSTLKVSFSGFTFICAVICIIAMGLASTAYLYIVKPLSPPSAKLSLLIHIRSMKISERLGLYNHFHQYDNQRTTNTHNDRTNISRNKGEKAPDTNPAPDSNRQNQNEESRDTQTESISENFDFTAKDESSPDQAGAVSYTFKSFWALKLIAVVLACMLLTIAAKKLYRRLWYLKNIRKDPRALIISFYCFYLKKFQVLGFKKKDQDTVYEYAHKMTGNLRSFSVGNADIHTLTNIFARVSYGNLDATKEECDLFLKFYQYFYKNCKRRLGIFKYSLKYLYL